MIINVMKYMIQLILVSLATYYLAYKFNKNVSIGDSLLISVISIIIIFFLIIASVIVARTMIGKHFQKKFGKRPPPTVIVATVKNKNLSPRLKKIKKTIIAKSF